AHEAANQGGWVRRTWRGVPWEIAPVSLLTSADVYLDHQRPGHAPGLSVRGAKGPVSDSRTKYVNGLLDTAPFRRLEARESFRRVRRLLHAKGGVFVLTASATIL